MVRVEDMLKKMMRRFDASGEHAKYMRGDLAIIDKKGYAHTISINHLELQTAQLSSNVKPRQPGTLPSNIIQNLKNDGHCMAVTTREGKQTMDPPIPFGVEDRKRGYDEVEKVSGELVDK